METYKIMSKKIGIILGLVIAGVIGLSTYLYINTGYQIKTEGKLYIVNKGSRNVIVFDLEKGEKIADIAIDIEPHEATTLSNQDYVVVTNYGNENTIGKTLTIINTKSNTIEKIIDIGESTKPHGITNIPNTNKVIVVTDVGNDLVVVDVDAGRVEKRIPTGGQLSHLVALHPNSKIAYASNIATNDISVIDIEEGVLIKTIKCGLGAEGIDVTPDGKEVWVTNNRDNTVSVINTESLLITHTLATGDQPLRLKFTHDGKQCLVVNAQHASVAVYSAYDKSLIKEIHFPGKNNLFERAIYHTPHPVGILIHPNGKYAFVANSNANRIEVIDLNTLAIVSTIKSGLIPDGMSLIK
jgi:YVTN family beta-propeller protein